MTLGDNNNLRSLSDPSEVISMCRQIPIHYYTEKWKFPRDSWKLGVSPSPSSSGIAIPLLPYVPLVGTMIPGVDGVNPPTLLLYIRNAQGSIEQLESGIQWPLRQVPDIRPKRFCVLSCVMHP